MKRKTFLKTSTIAVAGALVAPLTSCTPTPKNKTMRSNWAGNYQYKAEHLHEPESVEEVQTLVKKLDQQKALGSCHCFNDIADSPANQISTAKLNQVVSIDEKSKTLTVGAGARYGQFAEELDQKGYALHNLASLPHISVAGACATATHGSGVTNSNLATVLSGLEMVTADGEVHTLNRKDHVDELNGVVVGLGALGIVTRVSLDIQESFQVRQDLFQNLPLQSLQDHFDEIMASGYSVSLFTDWQNKVISQVWVKRKVETDTKDLGQDFYGAKAATKNLHPITRLSAENCTEQLGVPGPWYERLPHFKMGFTPSSGKELQAEYFVPRENAVDAILALEKKGDLIFPQLMISEIRTIAADELWMSPCYQRDCVAIHFTLKQNTPEVMKLLPIIEAELAPFQVRPHWGKLFSITQAQLQKSYPKFEDFRALAKKYDPKGQFRNTYLDLNLYAE